ncbi:MAG: hypothetical protein IJU84_02480, partial [Clostridia bacterium]|nr:hypothetical protein [Clostridia bacterium]
VTADYVGEEWGIEEGDEHRAWKVTIRNDIKWDDGTAINAVDFVESTRRLLDPKAQNSRADDYTYAGNFVMHNAENYVKQGSTVVEDNSATEKLGMEDLTKGADGKYTYNGVFAKFGLNVSNSWCGGKTLKYYSSYLDATAWTALDAMIDADGYVDITDETIALLTQAISTSAWNENADNLPCYLYYEATYPEIEFDKVGIKALSDNELVFILDQELKGFYLKYNLTSSWLVPIQLYDSLGKTVDGVYTNSYGTTVATTRSYGTYKLTYFQKDKSFKLEKNAYYFEYNDEENKNLWQTTNINVIRVASPSTRLQMFLNGQLDSYGLTANDMDDYSMSDHTYYTTEASTFFIALNPDLEALQTEQAKTAGTNKTILTVKQFRQALSFAMNRREFALATSPVNNAAYAAFSSLIIADPENGIAYRTTEEAKDAMLAFWGLTDQVGADKLYATKDDAIDAITGYDLAGAKKLFDEAYDIAIAEGLMTANDVVEIKVGTPNLTSVFYNNGYDYIVNNYTEAVKGTKLEGKLKFTRDGTLGNGFGDALRSNQVDMLFGVGFTGSALDPYGLVTVYSGAEESLRYDPSWKTGEVELAIELEGLEEGVEGKVVYTASIGDWTNALSNSKIKVSKIVDDKPVQVEVTIDSENYSVKTPVLAAIEKAVLEQYDMIPLIDNSSAALKGMKINYYTEEYVYGVGRGGLKYYTYNYNDSEWAKFVSDNGGTLNYK